MFDYTVLEFLLECLLELLCGFAVCAILVFLIVGSVMLFYTIFIGE